MLESPRATTTVEGLCISCDFGPAITGRPEDFYPNRPTDQGVETVTSPLLGANDRQETETVSEPADSITDTIAKSDPTRKSREEVMLSLAEHMAINRCERTKTGRCGAVEFLLDSLIPKET